MLAPLGPTDLATLGSYLLAHMLGHGTVTFRAGVPEVSPGPAPGSGCTILADPVAFLLLALGRCGPFSALARGKVLAWGRRAWLTPGFPLLFKAP